MKATTNIKCLKFGAIKASKRATEDKIEDKISYPNKFENKDNLIVSSSKKVKMEIEIDSDVKPRHVVFQFVSTDKSNRYIKQVIPKLRQKGYSLTIDINKKPFNKFNEATYKVSAMQLLEIH